MSREAAIRQTHASVTLDALEALANKGLLRRAQKDLERGEVAAFQMSETGLTVSLGGQRVTLTEAGPAKASCSCPAPGVCQHILTACLKLMQEPAPPPTTSAYDEWLAFSNEDLITAYGLPTLRTAHELSLAHEVQIDRAVVLTVRFPSLNAEVVALPGAGISGMIVSGMSEKRHASLAAAALLSARRMAGLNWEPPVSDKESAAPVHRDNVLKNTAALLEEAISSGLARLSPAMVERFDALAISAQTAELPRLGRLLQRIANQANDWLQRRPHADLGRLFNEIASAYALVHASPRLIDVGRESYSEVGALDLRGVAAWPWRTASGYEGLTLLLWDAANAAWNTWSDARPRTFQGGFSAVSRYTAPGPWSGVESPAQLVRSRFRIMNAKRNRWGRLSSSEQSQALVIGAADDTQLPVIDNWNALGRKIQNTIGLREHDPRSAYQLVRPATWERHPFDPISQSLIWMLHDGEGRTLQMRLPFDELTHPAIKALEAIHAHELEGSALLGRCFLVNGQMQIYPLAVQTGRQVIQLFFEGVKAAGSGNPAPGAPPFEEDDSEPDMEPLPIDSTALGELILASTSVVEWLAEAGPKARCTEARTKLDELSSKAHKLGTPWLARYLHLAATSTHSRTALQLRWILAVAQRALN